MAQAYDNSSSGGFSGSGSNLINTALNVSASCTLFGAFIYGGVGGTSISAISFGGIALTLLTSGGGGAGSAQGWNFYFIESPPTGNQTFKMNGNGDGSFIIFSYTGGDTNGITPDFSTSISASAATLVTTVNKSWTILVGLSTNSSSTWTAGSGSTMRLNPASSVLMDSNSQITPAGSYTMNYTGPGSVEGIIFSLAPNNPIRNTSDSIMNGASRTTTIAKIAAYPRVASDSFMNAASRLVVLFKSYTFTPSLSLMNAATRLITVATKGGIWKTTQKSSNSWTPETKD